MPIMGLHRTSALGWVVQDTDYVEADPGGF